MVTKRFTLLLLGFFLAGTLGFGQTTAEAARKEKERRDSVKGKKTVVVSNVDLGKAKKKPSLELLPAGTNPPGEAQAGAEGTAAEGASAEAADPEAKPPAEKTETDPALQAQQEEAKQTYEDRKAELQSKYDQAKERVELLNLKMAALQQQYYTFNNFTPKAEIQKQIAESYQKLQEAQVDALRAKDDLEKFLTQSFKEKLPEIWIK